MSLKRKQPEPSTPTSTSEVYRSNSIHDRSSTFVAVYSPTEPYKTLQADPKFRDASHRIAAWRRPSRQKALFGSAPAHFDTGFDDDGEKYAGKHVVKVLDELQVVGAVVVARWYGGVLLGPVRFEHIENVAREAIKIWKGAQVEEDVEHERQKKARTDQQDRERLVRDLPERDASIIALRGLLAQKKEDAPTSSAGPTTPVKAMNYSMMSIEVLRKLEKARDTTIAWLLKSIDEAEAKSKASATRSSTGDGEEGHHTRSDGGEIEDEALNELVADTADSEPETR